MKQLTQIEGIVRAPQRLAILHTERCKAVSMLFEQYQQQTGISIYRWTNGEGLHTLDYDPLVMADTKNPLDLLGFIQNSMQFAVYLLQDLPLKKAGRLNIELKRLLLMQRPSEFKIILLTKTAIPDSSLANEALLIDCGEPIMPAMPMPKAQVAYRQGVVRA